MNEGATEAELLITDHLRETQDAIRRLDELKAQLPEIVRHAVTEVEGRDRSSLLYALYWGWGGVIPTSWLVPLVDSKISASMLHQYVAPCPIEYECANCGTKYTHLVRSRTERQERAAPKWRHTYICPDCTAKRRAVRQSQEDQWAELARAQQARAADLVALCSDCHALYHQDGRMPA